MNLPLMLAEESIMIIAVAGGLLTGIVGIISGTIRRVKMERYREESRREIAAYVAEGSMSPDDAAKLLNAGKSWTERIGAGC